MGNVLGCFDVGDFFIRVEILDVDGVVFFVGYDYVLIVGS